jgi:hypothetical protein
MRFIVILFVNLFLLISCGILEPDSKISLLGPVIETANSQGKLEYVGRVVNNSQEKINEVSLRYIIRDEKDDIVEAVTFPILGSSGDYLSHGEIVIFKFFVRSDPKNIFNKELNLDYN